MRISDWSSDVCSSDLGLLRRPSTSSRQALWRLAMTVDFFRLSLTLLGPVPALIGITVRPVVPLPRAASAHESYPLTVTGSPTATASGMAASAQWLPRMPVRRSEEHTSELPSLMRISYDVVFLNKK